MDGKRSTGGPPGQPEIRADSSSEPVEQDVVVRIPPKRRYKIELKVSAVGKAQPRITEMNELATIDQEVKQR